jgi:hypothetical protein
MGFLGSKCQSREILWREVKYRWMDTKAYQSLENISRHVVNILENFEKKYDIKFG